jgi:hypothetical protein
MKSGGAINVKVKAILVIQQQYLYVACSLLLEHINSYCMRRVRNRLYNKPKFHCIVLWLESGNLRALIGVYPSTANCYRQLLYGSIFPPERARAVPPAEAGTPRKEFHMILQKERAFV